jgi:hypothetical protein
MPDRRYRVVAPYIVVKTAASGHPTSHGRPAIVGLYQNTWLPADVPADDVLRLLADGLIAPVEQPEPVEAID